MLTNVRLADVQLLRDAADFHRPFGQQMKHLQAARVREHPQDLCLQLVDRFHVPVIAVCECAHTWHLS